MKKSFHVAGYSTCKPFQQARKALQGLEAVYPDLYTVTVDECKILRFLTKNLIYWLSLVTILRLSCLDDPFSRCPLSVS